MKQFINALKNSSYYTKLTQSDDIIGIYILGSRSVGVIDDNSDYDIIILTLGGNYIDCSQEEFLTYKGKKVHWYYTSLKSYLTIKPSILKLLSPIQIRNLNNDLVIYENEQYSHLIEQIYKHKTSISLCGIYKLFEVKENYINQILEQNAILENNYSKYIYHLVLCSYYLLGDNLDVKFLRELKRIRWQPIKEDYKQKAIERLRLLRDEIKANPLNVEEEYAKLLREMGVNTNV